MSYLQLHFSFVAHVLLFMLLCRGLRHDPRVTALYGCIFIIIPRFLFLIPELHPPHTHTFQQFPNGESCQYRLVYGLRGSRHFPCPWPWPWPEQDVECGGRAGAWVRAVCRDTAAKKHPRHKHVYVRSNLRLLRPPQGCHPPHTHTPPPAVPLTAVISNRWLWVQVQWSR